LKNPKKSFKKGCIGFLMDSSMNVKEQANNLLDKMGNNRLGLTRDETEFLEMLLLNILGIDHEEVQQRLQDHADDKLDYWDRGFPSSVK
jgi:hypothetical protein